MRLSPILHLLENTFWVCSLMAVPQANSRVVGLETETMYHDVPCASLIILKIRSPWLVECLGGFIFDLSMVEKLVGLAALPLRAYRAKTELPAGK